jgi:hypothetical protein
MVVDVVEASSALDLEPRSHHVHLRPARRHPGAAPVNGRMLWMFLDYTVICISGTYPSVEESHG